MADTSGLLNTSSKSSFSDIDVTKLTPLSPEVICKQATINIGTIGHVAHGKSTVVKALSGVQTVRFKNELERNITIKLDEEEGGGDNLVDSTVLEEEDLQVLAEIGTTIKEIKKPSKEIKKEPSLRPSVIQHTEADSPSGTSGTEVKYKPGPKSKTRPQEAQLERKSKRNSLMLNDSDNSSAEDFDMSERVKKRRTETIQSDAEPPKKIGDRAAKRQRTESIRSDVSDSSFVSSEGKPVKKAGSKKSVSREYRKKKSFRSKRKKKSQTVTRDTPSETRVVEEDGPINLDIGRQTDGEYEVEIVKCSKFIEGRQYYFVKWKGWAEAFNTWEPVENLIHSQEALYEFFKSESKRERERLNDAANKVPGMSALPAKFYDFEREIVATLKSKDFKDFKVDTPENLQSMLPNHKLLCSHIGKYMKQEDPELMSKIRKMVTVREFVRLRCEQLESLARWEKEANAKCGDKVGFTIENNEDLEGPPDNFHFAKSNLPGEGVTIPDDPPVGCYCSNCEEDTSCCGAQSGSKFAYTSEGLLKVEHGTPVYECNKRCRCGTDCPNRVVQNGRTVKLHIFRTPNNIGWGVRVAEDVPQGKFVCEYIGEVVKREVADDRIKNEYKGRPLYIFDLDFNDAKNFPYTVDAYQSGNVSHFVNHSCEPNLAVYAVWIDCLDPNLPRLAMFAIRDIKAGEELTFDYSAQYHRKRKLQTNSKGLEKLRRPGKTPCKCGSSMCREVLF